MFWKPEPKFLRSGLPDQDGSGSPSWYRGRTGRTEQTLASSSCPNTAAMVRWRGMLSNHLILPSCQGRHQAWQGLWMHNWLKADYLQVQLGWVKNSISSVLALGTRFHRGGLFLVNKEEMASHFTVITGRGHQFVYLLQRGSTWAPQAWRQRPRVKEWTHFSGQKQVVPQPSTQTGNTGPPQSNPTLEAHPANTAHPHGSQTVFHFLTITILSCPKPNTETLPSVYQAQRRALKVSVICYSLLCF